MNFSVYCVQADMPDVEQSQMDKLAQSIADTYKTLDTSDKDRHVVLAYGLQNNKHKNIEEEMIRHETGKLLI